MHRNALTKVRGIADGHPYGNTSLLLFRRGVIPCVRRLPQRADSRPVASYRLSLMEEDPFALPDSLAVRTETGHYAHPSRA